MGIFEIFLLGKLKTWFWCQTPCFLAWGITWDHFQTPQICPGGQMAILTSQISSIWDKFITFVLKAVETCFWCLFQVFWHDKLIGTSRRSPADVAGRPFEPRGRRRRAAGAPRTSPAGPRSPADVAGRPPEPRGRRRPADGAPQTSPAGQLSPTDVAGRPLEPRWRRRSPVDVAGAPRTSPEPRYSEL